MQRALTSLDDAWAKTLLDFPSNTQLATVQPAKALFKQLVLKEGKQTSTTAYDMVGMYVNALQ